MVTEKVTTFRRREETDVIAEIRRKHVEEAAEAAGDNFDQDIRLFGRECESPIERVMLAAMISRWESACSFMPADKVFLVPHAGEYIVSPQFPAGRYRVDFAIFDLSEEGKPKLIVVECDGHDYHERTKEQATRDRRRDRFFTQRGIRFLRFTGSEIWADPIACIEQIEDLLWPANSTGANAG
jgi:very-short-patch-repair endonuclease